MTIKPDSSTYIAPPYRSSVNNPLIKLIRPHQDWFFTLVLSHFLKGCHSVLDAGCGYNSPIRLVKRPGIYKHGFDIYSPVIKISKSQNIHNKYSKGDIRRIDRFFRPKSFDAVMCFQVIEHLDKRDGIKLLHNLETIARKIVLIATPNGRNEHDDFDGNPYQFHKSYWTREEFAQKGYRVYGSRGAKFLRGKYGAIYKKPWVAWAILSFITEPLLYYLPQYSYDLIAVKVIKG